MTDMIGPSPTPRSTTVRPVTARTISNTANTGPGSTTGNQLDDVNIQAILEKAKNFKGNNNKECYCYNACSQMG